LRESDLVARSHAFGFIDHVYVDAEVRMLGVFKRLFGEGMQWLRNQGATEVEGVIWAQNKAVLNLFRKLGYEPVRYLLRKQL
jgi:ribosomal protein S18 acetylase RimI-like enzyme